MSAKINITFDEIAHIRKLLAAPAPLPLDCAPDCEHIKCSFVVACEKHTADQALRARTLIEPLLGAVEQALHDLEQAWGQEKQTGLVLDGFVGDLEKAHNAQVPTEIRCPKCNLLHVDQDEWATTRLHRKHLCHGCGNIWQPYPVTTTGCDFHVECRANVARLEADITWMRSTWELAEEEVKRLRTHNETVTQRSDDITQRRDELLKKGAQLVADADVIIARDRTVIATANTIIAALQAENAQLSIDNAALAKRRDELLAMVAKLSQTVPLESEVAEALQQRGTLLAEVGTLRARITELEKLDKANDKDHS